MGYRTQFNFLKGSSKASLSINQREPRALDKPQLTATPFLCISTQGVRIRENIWSIHWMFRFCYILCRQHCFFF